MQARKAMREHEHEHERALGARAASAAAWLFDDALPVWANRGRNPRGGWHDRLDDDYRAVAGPMRMRVQARQVFVFAEAGRLGWSGPWRESVDHGLDFLINRAARSDGLAAQSFDGDDGRVLQWGPVLYDQAFTLFAYAAAYRATRDPRAKTGAVRLLEALAPQAHPGGGFREFDSALLRANPHMHMLEAALQWAQADDDPRWPALARELAALCAERLVDPVTDALHEIFIDDWRRAPAPAGELTEPGHHFEWAWLLDAGRLGTPSDLPLRLCERGERLGVDRRRGVAVNAIGGDGTVLDPCARLWPQTERLKAALAMRPHDPELWTGRACAAHDILFGYMAPAPRGLWRDVVEADGSLRPEDASASSLYHITCAISELGRATGVLRAQW